MNALPRIFPPFFNLKKMGYNKQELTTLWDDGQDLFKPEFAKDGPIALIDADSLLYYEMGKSTLEEAMQGIDERIINILQRCDTPNLAGFLTIGKCFRYDIAKIRPYKYNRKGGSKPIIFYALKEYVQQRWNFKGVRGLEADDLVSIYKTHNKNSIICSPDKDVLYQNTGKHYNYNKAEFIVTTRTQATRFLWKQVLMGDSTDGIPGLPKIGPKTADKWVKNEKIDDLPQFVLKKYIEKFGTLDGIRNFTETFNLIYILRGHEQVQYTEANLGKLQVFNVNDILYGQDS